MPISQKEVLIGKLGDVIKEAEKLMQEIQRVATPVFNHMCRGGKVSFELTKDGDFYSLWTWRNENGWKLISAMMSKEPAVRLYEAVIEAADGGLDK